MTNDIHFETVAQVYRGHDINEHHKGALRWYTIGRSSERHLTQAAARLEIDRRMKDAR